MFKRLCSGSDTVNLQTRCEEMHTHIYKVHTTLIPITTNNSSEIHSGYQAIKHSHSSFPAATKHVTILLCSVLGALSKDDRRSHLFPRVSALITAWLLALPRLYKCQSKVHPSLWQRILKKKSLLLGNTILLDGIRAFKVNPPFFLFSLKTSYVCCHYSFTLSRFFKRPRFDI